MSPHAHWSINLGRWWFVSLRLHASFFLFALFAAYLGWLSARTTGDAHDMTLAVTSMGVLAMSVLLHELAHATAAFQVSGLPQRAVLWPLGGLEPPRTHPEPQAELLAVIAGPVANGVVCLAAAVAVTVLGGGPIQGLLHPLRPAGLFTGTELAQGLNLVFWINWLLMLINLLPAFPFDGGRALRVVLPLAWPRASRRDVGRMMEGASLVIALGLMVMGAFVVDAEPVGPAPPWLALAVLALAVFFAGRSEAAAASPAQPPIDPGDAHLFERREDRQEDIHADGPITRWLRQRRELARARAAEQVAEDERRMDRVLEKLHALGPDSLTREERAVLERVSARYRLRQSQEPHC